MHEKKSCFEIKQNKNLPILPKTIGPYTYLSNTEEFRIEITKIVKDPLLEYKYHILQDR